MSYQVLLHVQFCFCYINNVTLINYCDLDSVDIGCIMTKLKCASFVMAVSVGVCIFD